MRKNNFSFLRTAEQAAINANGKVDETDFSLTRISWTARLLSLIGQRLQQIKIKKQLRLLRNLQAELFIYIVFRAYFLVNIRRCHMDILKLVLTTLLSSVSLFIIAKIMGHKQMAQLDFFDYIGGITIGSIAAELATELEAPWKPLLAMIIYGSISLTLSLVANKFPRSRRFINGAPTIILNDGVFYRRNMKKAKLDLSEFMMLCRQEGYFNICDIKTAIFEYNGHLTILPISTKRPATPEDMNLSPQQEHINTEVIMDGRILEGNLKKMGISVKWLQKQLKNQGYHSEKEIYLGLCDQDRKLSLFIND